MMYGYGCNRVCGGIVGSLITSVLIIVGKLQFFFKMMAFILLNFTVLLLFLFGNIPFVSQTYDGSETIEPTK